MNEISLTILPEALEDAPAIERLNARTFGPGRFAKSAYRLREEVAHSLELSFTARVGTLLIGSVRLSPILIGAERALLLGPLTVEPPFRDRGIGLALIERALAEAKTKGHRLVVLVGDEPYYGKAGFRHIPKGRVTMPGPVDPERMLIAELAAGASQNVSGAIRPDWGKP
jgi:predicted N-acetyltransferase YhbS